MGGNYPGEKTVACLDAPDTTSYTHVGTSPINVYFIVEGKNMTTGNFSLVWEIEKVDLPLIRAGGKAEIRPGVPFVPQIFFEEKYHPMCSLGFNDDGATTVCRVLGLPHHNGRVDEIQTVVKVDTMPIGSCLPGEELTACTNGDNAFGNFGFADGACTAGNSVGFHISCYPAEKKFTYKRCEDRNLDDPFSCNSVSAGETDCLRLPHEVPSPYF